MFRALQRVVMYAEKIELAASTERNVHDVRDTTQATYRVAAMIRQNDSPPVNFFFLGG